MKLTRVTITGADDSIDPQELARLSEKYPFVEWGILYSRSSQGRTRFPTLEWIGRLPTDLNYAAHLCGGYVRDLVLNNEFSWAAEPAVRPELYQRAQLNFHGQFHAMHPELTIRLHDHGRLDFIFQCDGVNDARVQQVCESGADRFVPLFDTSGGAGVLPKRWPEAWPLITCGYAGGLGPWNVVEQLKKIADRADGQPFWIDMERRVRSQDDTQFDLAMVERVLEVCAPFVRPSVEARLIRAMTQAAGGDA